MALTKDEAKIWLVILISAALSGVSLCAVYKVGDSAGWTTSGNIDYNNWASSKNFLVGDTLVFEYDQQLHNVLRVVREDYHECNGNSPISTYATGNDSFTIKTPGHFFFLCGVPGHCEAGQKLDVRVLKTSSPPEIIPTSRVPPSGLLAAPEASMAPAPAQSSAAAARLTLQILLLVLAFCFSYASVS